MQLMSIARRITVARERAGMTQTELARRLNLAPQSVQQWESGVSAPRARRLAEVARVLGVSEGYFFQEEPVEAGADEFAASNSVHVLARAIADELVQRAGRGGLDRTALEALASLIKKLAMTTDQK